MAGNRKSGDLGKRSKLAGLSSPEGFIKPVKYLRDWKILQKINFLIMKNILQNRNISPECIGLIPAAGQATRVSPLPCSKELYPLGFRDIGQGHGVRPKVVCHYLLEKMQVAGVAKAYIILRDNKWDIPAYLGDGKLLDMHLAYLMLGLPFGVPHTLDQAYPFLQDARVVFGFPDIIFKPQDAFLRLMHRQEESKADVVLGLFPVHRPQKMDMVDVGRDGRVRGITIKPSQSDLRYTWIIGVWTAVFTQFMHDYLSNGQTKKNTHQIGKDPKEERELFLGDVIQAAIYNKMLIDTVIFERGSYLDIGTPEDLYEAANIANELQEVLE
jgi:glucose-1-phosphate thymidylyltransferase